MASGPSSGFDDSLLDARIASKRQRAGGRQRLRWRRRSRTHEPDPALLARIAAPLERGRRVMISSSKGGVGKTTTTLLLGHALAAHRVDRVLAIDTDVAGGSLRERAGHASTSPSDGDGSRVGIDALLRQGGQVRGYADLRAHTVSTPSGLEILPSPRGGGDRPIHSSEYLRLLQRVERSYGVVLLDTSTGILDELTSGVRDSADQLLLVLRPSIDEARAAAMTLDILIEEGAERMVADAVVLANGFRGSSGVDTSAVLARFTDRCRSVIEVPFDPALDHGGTITRSDLLPATREAFLSVAAAVADGFALPGSRS